ncbi:MAG: hypothetical protein A2V98_20960 [Planctomycetes bacterium RBG_16_64_12]|nr:MAG: hypothetical protein A2V98_20960 [Planctomycetes bacterium RBG_16_64_12]
MNFLVDLGSNLWLYPVVTLFFVFWPIVGSVLFMCFEYNCSFKDREKRRAAVYLALATYTGTGSNKITPQTWRGEWIAVLNGIIGISALAYFIAIFVESL